MIPYVIAGLSIILSLLLEGSVLSFFVVERALPDLLLVLVITWGFILGERRGAILGLIGGLLQDVLFGAGLGCFALAKMLAGYGAGLLEREFFRERLLAPVLLVFTGTLFHELVLNLLVSRFTGLGFPVAWTLHHFLIPKALYNAGLTLFIYPLFCRFDRGGHICKKKIHFRGENF